MAFRDLRKNRKGILSHFSAPATPVKGELKTAGPSEPLKIPFSFLFLFSCHHGPSSGPERDVHIFGITENSLCQLIIKSVSFSVYIRFAYEMKISLMRNLLDVIFETYPHPHIKRTSRNTKILIYY